jgi:hypothetical protein
MHHVSSDKQLRLGGILCAVRAVRTASGAHWVGGGHLPQNEDIGVVLWLRRRRTVPQFAQDYVLKLLSKIGDKFSFTL